MRKTYYSEDDWALVEVEDYANWSSWIIHKCKTTCDTEPADLTGAWIDARTEGSCYYCDQQPPNGIMSLWRLHNWDKIQKWAASGYPI